MTKMIFLKLKFFKSLRDSFVCLGANLIKNLGIWGYAHKVTYSNSKIFTFNYFSNSDLKIGLGKMVSYFKI